MKNQLLFLLLICMSINCYSQISFEKGYFINNFNQKVDCLIKNIDWEDNPTDFEYRLSENSKIKTNTIESVKEFGINSVSKYIRSSVNIDRSSREISEVSYDKNPIFKEEKLFLNTLVEGKANLYLYESGNLVRYFFSKDNSDIEQLIFKSYKTQENQIGQNNGYKQQLWINLKCPNFTENKIENIGYYKRELVNFFIEYNECNNEGYTKFGNEQKKDLFNLSIRPGFNYSSLSIEHSTLSNRDIDFGNELTFRLGVEAEFILPTNKNKWAIIIEPTYQYFKSEKESPTENGKVDYKSIEFPVGIRHYFFLNNNSKIFINGSYILEFGSNSKVENEILADDLEIKKSTNMAFGIGFKNYDKYSLELRYQTTRDILRSQSYSSAYNTLSIIFGYTIF